MIVNPPTFEALLNVEKLVPIIRNLQHAALATLNLKRSDDRQVTYKAVAHIVVAKTIAQ
jgi:hypothetical protein